jgi:hypothetical protein
MKRKAGYLNYFYPINDYFGCFIEHDQNNEHRFVNLVEYDFIDKVFQKIQTFKLTRSWNERIFVDESDPSKFTLTWRTNNALHIRSIELSNGKANLGNTVQFARNGYWIDHYFNGCVYDCYIPNYAKWGGVS